MELITTEKLTKQYGNLNVVDEVSLSVNKGEIYGFLGLNGAGKTTTIRMLLGMIRPTSGHSYINGQRVFADNHTLWNEVGYLVEVPYSYPNLTVRENLEIVRRLRGLSDKGTIDRIIDKLKLNAYTNKRAKDLSLGNAQRLGLAKALIHNPKILMLDEPSNGLDPEGIHEIRELLKDLAFNQGVTIFISSHILEEVSRFATRIGIIHEGKLIQEHTISELEQLREKVLHIQTTDTSKALLSFKQNGYEKIELVNGEIQCHDEKAILFPAEIATMMVNEGIPPTHLSVEQEDLETYFLRAIKKH